MQAAEATEDHEFAAIFDMEDGPSLDAPAAEGRFHRGRGRGHHGDEAVKWT